MPRDTVDCGEGGEGHGSTNQGPPLGAPLGVQLFAARSWHAQGWEKGVWEGVGMVWGVYGWTVKPLPGAVDTCAPKFVVAGDTVRVFAGGWGPGVGATYAGRHFEGSARRWCKLVGWCTLGRGEVGCWRPWAPFSLRTSWFLAPVECFKAPDDMLGAQAACLAPRAGEGGADLHAPFHREGGGQSQHVGSPIWLQPALHVPL